MTAHEAICLNFNRDPRSSIRNENPGCVLGENLTTTTVSLSVSSFIVVPSFPLSILLRRHRKPETFVRRDLLIPTGFVRVSQLNFFAVRSLFCFCFFFLFLSYNTGKIAVLIDISAMEVKKEHFMK